MRSRLVIWGTNEKEERVLLAIALNADENKIDIWSIPDKDISEDFYNQMMSQWREGSDLQLPDSASHRVTELTMADAILPEDLKVEKSDVIQRAQLEWHFVVLSNKLYRNYKSELEDIGDKIKRLEEYDEGLWEELRNLWANVQQHIFDKNLMRDHADSLKEKTNSLFEELKKLRKARHSELQQKSKEVFQSIQQRIDEVLKRIEAGAVLKPLFEELVQIQNELKTKDMLRSDRQHIMTKLNEGFKAIRERREKRSGNQEDHGNAAERLSKRFEGLLGAIKKLEQSIAFEQKNIDFENRRIATTDGQLEAQIRVAKIKLIEERLKSKQAKLNELLETKEKLELLSTKLKKREEKTQKRIERKEKVEEEKEKIKAHISETIHAAQDQIPEAIQEKLTKAAEEIKSSKKGSRKKDHKPQEQGETSLPESHSAGAEEPTSTEKDTLQSEEE